MHWLFSVKNTTYILLWVLLLIHTNLRFGTLILFQKGNVTVNLRHPEKESGIINFRRRGIILSTYLDSVLFYNIIMLQHCITSYQVSDLCIIVAENTSFLFLWWYFTLWTFADFHTSFFAEVPKSSVVLGMILALFCGMQELALLQPSR